MQLPNSCPPFRAGLGLALVLTSFPACKAKLPEELPAPASHAAAEQSGQATSSGAAGSGTGLPPAPGAPGERPSLEQNMGRGFQGTLALRLEQSSGARDDLRYMSLGNTARLQIDALQQPKPPAQPLHFDALIWGESISLLDHQERTVRTLPLRQIRRSQEPELDVKMQETGERSSIKGVFCEAYRLQQGPIRIDACVAGLPGEVDVDKLEAVSGIDVPPWAEYLLKKQLLPLHALARDAAGRELYRLELVQYSAGPVERELLVVPSNYRQLTAQP